MLGEGVSPQDVAEMRTRLGLDRPLLVRYATFLKGIAVGDLGTSLRTNQPVARAIAERCRRRSSWRWRRWRSRSWSRFLSDHGGGPRPDADRSCRHHPGPHRHLDPEFLARTAAGNSLRGRTGMAAGLGPRHASLTLILPAITLGAPLAAVLARMTRASVIEELSELVRAGRARARCVTAARGACATPFGTASS